MRSLVGLVILLVLAVFAHRNSDQDKLDRHQLAQRAAADPESCCAQQRPTTSSSASCSAARRVRGSDQAAFDQMPRYAVVRMENPVLESQDNGPARWIARALCRSTCRPASRSPAGADA